MAITPVDLTNTFDVWRTRTNQLITLAESTNTAVASAFTKANAVGAGANAFTSTTVAGANTAVGTGANNFMIAVQNGSNTAVGTGANAFASATISGANTAVGTGANAFTSATIAGANTAVGTGANNFMIAVQNGSNTAIGSGANAFTSATIAGANTAVGAGANTVGVAAFAKANAALANTSGATFNGNLTISTTLTVSSNLTISSGTINTASANISSQTLTDGATITWNAAAGQIAYITLGGNRIFAAPTSLRVGTYILHVIQDGTGNRTITWNSVFKFTAGVAPVLTTTAGRRDIISFVSDGTNLYGTYMPDVR